MARKWLSCKGIGCPAKHPLDPTHPHCGDCGTPNPEFDEGLMTQENGATLAELQASECTPAGHAQTANEIMDMAAEDEKGPPKEWYCIFCGACLIKDYKPAVSITQ